MSSQPKLEIAVVGAGVIGLSVALCLKERYKARVHVTVIADKFSPGITSDGAGAIFVPYLLDFDKSTLPDLSRWTTVTFDRLQQLYQSETHKWEEDGIELVTCHWLMRTHQPLPWWKDLFPEFKELNEVESKEAQIPQGKFCKVWRFKSFTIRSTRYLAWLRRNFVESGGKVEKCRINSLSELSAYDVIINCTGLGARELVGDESVYPIKGQIVVVDAPNVREYWDSGVSFVLPHSDYVLLGCTEEYNEWSTTVSDAVTQEIFKECVEMVPKLQGAKIVGSWACLRPMRRCVRLEIESGSTQCHMESTITEGQLNRSPRPPSHTPIVIHCYGHGGQGFVFSWGCAVDVAKLVDQELTVGQLQSKL